MENLKKTSSKNSPQILVVEDDATTRVLIKRILLKSIPDYIYHEADDLESILDVISHNSIDCILLDYFLANDDGLMILQRLRSDKVYIPVIVLTNQTDDTVAAGLIKEGATDYFSKSILQEKNVQDILRRSITNSIEKYRLLIENKQARQALELRERRYRGLIENSPILIMRFFNDEEKMITFVNDGFCNYNGINRYELLGEDIAIIIDESEREEFFIKIARINKDQPVLSFEQKGFGKKIDNWQFWTIEGIFDDEDEIIEYQCMGEDISDLKTTQHQLQDSLKKVEELKSLQDGDYFLTSLLLEPFMYNKSTSTLLEIDIEVKQKKEFTFKKWNRSLGGDLSLAHSVPLSGKRYTFFTNADAMGKSMQGAGGAIVYAAVLQSIINRVRLSSIEQDTYPEMWLQETFREIQGVFESFDGSMLLSAILGLIDDETGFVCFLNAEHPDLVLYRNGSASFLHTEGELRKIGVSQKMEALQINTIQLQDNDVLISASDGRDDIILTSENKINEDENLFLQNVEAGKGKLEDILIAIMGCGELTDDASFIRIQKNAPKFTEKKMTDNARTKKLDAIKKLSEKKEIINKISGLSNQFPGNPSLLKDILHFMESRKMHDESLLYYLVYCEIRPYDEEMMYRATICFKNAGQPEKARLFLERLVLRSPKNIDWLSDLAQVQFELKNFMEADRLLDWILNLDHNNKKALSMKNNL